MDAISGSASGSGFDAALKALEDLETSSVQTREDKPAASPTPLIETVGAIGFSDVEDLDLPAAIGFSDVEDPDIPVAIVAVPILEIPKIAAEPAKPVIAPDPAPAKAETAPFVPLPVAPLPVAVPPAAPVPAAASRFTKVAIGLGLLSSMVSAIGLVVAERTIMSAQLVVADARERQQQFAQANRLIHDLQLVRDKQIELLRAQQAQLAATPVTSEELKYRMDVLQTGLLARDPMNDVVRAIREGQTDNNARFNEFGMKITRLEAAVEGH